MYVTQNKNNLKECGKVLNILNSSAYLAEKGAEVSQIKK